MRKLILLFGVILSVQSFAQDSLAYKIIERHRKAISGSRGTFGLRKVIYYAPITFFDSLEVVTVTDTMNRLYIRQASRRDGTLINIYNQGKGIQIDGGVRKAITDSAWIKEMADEASSRSTFDGMLRQGKKINYLQKTTQEGYKLDVIMITDKEGKVTLEYYDEETGFLTVTKSPNGQVQWNLDYIEKEGRYIPERVILIFNEKNVLRLQLKSVSYDNPKDAAYFDL